MVSWLLSSEAIWPAAPSPRSAAGAPQAERADARKQLLDRLAAKLRQAMLTLSEVSKSYKRPGREGRVGEGLAHVWGRSRASSSSGQDYVAEDRCRTRVPRQRDRDLQPRAPTRHGEEGVHAHMQARAWLRLGSAAVGGRDDDDRERASTAAHRQLVFAERHEPRPRGAPCAVRQSGVRGSSGTIYPDGERERVAIARALVADPRVARGPSLSPKPSPVSQPETGGESRAQPVCVVSRMRSKPFVL